ncbi:MAG TPA: pyruvate kinase, partial [Candidatus Methylacidiphilales bacterium]
CNRRGLPVITATQMLESMVRDPRPTRAEASDVANAILDGTDAVMLSAETAAGAYPARAVEMMHRIAAETEASMDFGGSRSRRRAGTDIDALSEAANVIARAIHPHSIVVLTTSGVTARSIAAERSGTPVVALTDCERTYHALNLFWGINPILEAGRPQTFEGLAEHAEKTLLDRKLAAKGEKILVIGGLPAGTPRGANFVKIHTLG